MRLINCVFAFALWASCATARSAEFISVKLARVVDGDTVVVVTPKGRTERVRLLGIDAPERNQPGGVEAAALLTRLVGVDSLLLEVPPRGSRDSYGRVLAIARVHERGSPLNLDLIVQGYAWADRAHAPSRWLLAEAIARVEKRGLWATQPAIPPWVWRRTAKPLEVASRRQQ